MRFDWTVNLGNVIVGVGLFLGFLSAHIQNIKKLQDIETKVSMMFNWFQNRMNKSINGEQK